MTYQGSANRTYKINGKSSDYCWKTMDDGRGIIVWKPGTDWYHLLEFGTFIQFNDGKVESGSDTHEFCFHGDENPHNQAPDAKDDVAVTDEDTAVYGNVLDNDRDPDGDDLWVSLVTAPDSGNVVLNEDGTYTYTPNAGFSGFDSFTYLIDDGMGGTDTAVVYIQVNPVDTNSAPITMDDVAYTNAGTSVSGSVLDNDSDPDGDMLNVSLTVGPDSGTVVLNADGTYTYTPNAGFSGFDSFTYTADDGNGGTSSSIVWIQIKHVDTNSAPIANDDSASTTEDTAITGSVLGNDSDPDGDALTTSLAIDAENGSVVVNADGTYTYTPNAGFTGTDTFSYFLNDGKGGIDTAVVTITVTEATGGNNAPVGNDDSGTGEKGEDITGNVLGNDTDPDGDDLTATLATGPANGSVVLNDDGSYTYTPNTGFVGNDSFTYTISDGKGGEDTATVNLVVSDKVDPNNAPDAVDDSGAGDKNEDITGNVLGNDTDPDGDDLTASLTTGPANGSVVLNDDGSYTYTPNTGFVGNDSFTYTISDGKGGEDTATVNLVVSDKVDPNNAPDAVDDSGAGDKNEDITGNVLGNDTDPDGDDLTATLTTGPANGSVVLNDDGSYTYTPNTGFVGNDSFTYTISDGKGGEDTATVNLVVSDKVDPNNAPDAVDDSGAGDKNEDITGNVLGNDTDPDGDDLTASLTTGPANGSVVLNDDGSYTYTPNTGFVGNDSFTYTISDGKGGEDTATVNLVVSDKVDPNNAPDAVDDSGAGDKNEDITGNVLGNDTDPDGDDLTATLTTGPANGSVVLNDDGSYTYTPNTGFVGNDSFTYTISDGKGGEDTATVNLVVSDKVDPNNAPDAVDDSGAGDKNEDITGNVLGNDTDPDGDDLTASLTTGPANGSVVLNDDGSYTYTPNTGFVGNDSFTYTISDGKGGEDTATVNLVVSDKVDPNNAPDAVDDSGAGDKNEDITGNVLGNDTDPDGDDLTASLATGPANGSVVLNDDGSYTYTPNTGFVGNDSFTYTISDGKGGEDTATVNLVVSDKVDPNNAPDAVDDSGAGDKNEDITGNVLGNDTDPDGDDLTATLATGPANGSVVLNDDGSYTYTPNTGFVGNDSFTYTISDGKGGEDTATVNLVVSDKVDPNNAPDAVDDSGAGDKNEDITGNVLGNDTDPDGDDLTATLATGPANGSVVLNDDGSYTYTPNTGFVGNDSFTYTISDGKGGEDTATVNLVVSDKVDPNNAPDAVDDSETTDYGTPVSGNVLGNDTDPDGDDLTATLATGPANGSVVLNDDGSYTYTPDDGFSGEDTFTYTIDDGNGGSDTATVTITVGEEQNQDPDAVDDANTTTEGTPVSGSVLDNDSDPDGDDLTATLATGPLNGSVVLNDDGTYTYTPDDGFTGNDSFTYTISDGKGGEDTATVVISVSDAPNQDPDAVDDSETTDYGTPVSGNMLGNDTDPDGDDLTATLATGPANGSVVLNDDGSYTYTPDDGFSGEDTFTYTIDDGNGGSDTATVTITVGEEKNQDPDAVDDANTTTEGTPVSGSVLDNDSDPDGDDLTATLATGPLNGSVVLNDDGTYTYTPDDGFTGNDSFTYTISDGKGGEDTATVVISVSDAPNQDPDAVDDSETTDYGTPVSGNVLGNDTDPDGDDLTATLATGPANGSVVLNDDGSYTYTPDDGFSGEDTFTYTIDDGNGGSDTATVTITVGEEKNQDPDAVDDANTTTEGTPVSGSVLDNDSDPDGDDLTATLATGPLNGSVVLNDDGTYTYTPDDGFTGNDSFTYTISDGKGGEDTATVVISVGDAPNQDPDAVDDSETTDYGTPVSGNVLGNDTDPDGDDLTATLATGPANGSVVLNDDGSYTYTPDDGFSGEDTFTYTIDDGNGGSDTATVTITVGEEKNQDPDAVDDANTTTEGTPVSGSVLDNDSDPDGDDLTATLATGPLNGSVVLNDDGTYTYTPDDGFTGNDSFTYTISDGKGGEDTATVVISVSDAPNQDPDAVDDSETTDYGTPVSGNVLGNDTDPDGDDLTATLATGPANGSVVLNDDGSYTYTPDDGFSGEDTFTYTIDDGNGGSDTATVTITVGEEQNQDPDAVDDDNTTTEGTPVSGSVLDNDSDPDGDDLTATLATGPLNGSVVLNDDGTYTYTPDDGFTGNDSFTYTISDGKGGEDTATVVINVSDAPNQDPDAVDDSETTDYGTPVSGNVLGNDSDPDGDDLTATLATGPANGSVVLNDDGSYTYTPDDGFSGDDSFTYTIDDGNGGSDTATVTITVGEEKNQDPDAVDDANTTTEGTPVSGSVLDNDSDPDGDDLTATLATGPLNGSVVLNDDWYIHLHS